MKVRFLEDVDGYKEGETRDLPRETAWRYIKRYSAELVSVKQRERAVVDTGQWEAR